MPDDTIEIPVEGTGESEMADCSPQFSEQAANTLLQIGNVAQANFVTVNKIIDYDYLECKNMVSLTEALGAREVASKSVPAGPASV
jgi:hypothetical protein